MNFLNPWHILAYVALSSGKSDCFRLIPCYVGETPSAAIALFHKSRLGIDIVPLFVALTGDMDIMIPESHLRYGCSVDGKKRDETCWHSPPIWL